MNDVDIMNTEGGTFFRANLKSESVIDLAFTTRFKATRWQNWRYIEHSGSDHEMIAFEAVNNSQFTPTSSLRTLYNYKKAKWEQFDQEFRIRLKSAEFTHSNLESEQQIDTFLQSLEVLIHFSTDSSVPKLKVVERSKSWCCRGAGVRAFPK